MKFVLPAIAAASLLWAGMASAQQSVPIPPTPIPPATTAAPPEWPAAPAPPPHQAAPASPQAASPGLSQINPTAGPTARAAPHRRPGRDTAERRETRALNNLEAAGYRDFSGVVRIGRAYRATVTQGGRQFDVLVDPEHGQIAQQN